MFTEIGIENFKSFGKMQRIPLKPITLLYGPNSSGKSSLMQALLLFKQTLDEGGRKQGALIPRGQLLDAGTYREFINGHNEQKEFGFSIAMDASSLAEDDLAWVWNPTQTIALGMRFALDRQRNIRVKAIDISDRVGGEVVTAYRLLDDIPEMQSAISMWESIIQEFVEKNDPEAIKNSNYKQAKEELEKLKTSNMLCRTELNLDHPCVKARWDYNADSNRRLQEEGEEPSDMGLTEEMTPLRERLAKARAKEAKAEENTLENIQAKEEIKKCERYLSFLESLQKSIQDLSDSDLMEMVAVFHNNYGYFDRLIALGNCFPQKLVTGEEYRFIHAVSQAGALTEQRASDARETDEAHCFYLPYTAVLLASRCFQDMLALTTYIGPLRAMPERMYAYSGTAPATVGSKGENTMDILIARPDILEKVNAWLKRLEAGYEINVRPVVRDYYEIVLISTETGIESCIKDVGFGISQILPILVDGLISDRYEWNGQYYDRSEWSYKFIEQPEIHIHPRLQTELADFFIEGAKKKPCQYIIETHSEHLLLRLLRRIRETTNGELEEGQPPLKPEDVAVIYAKPTEHGTELMELRISEDGDFIDKWPEGFFTEREKELF
ncbi:MAG: DUF3696 domain-containing protein [Deltaproteobacteria bacterium]